MPYKCHKEIGVWTKDKRSNTITSCKTKGQGHGRASHGSIGTLAKYGITSEEGWTWRYWIVRTIGVIKCKNSNFGMLKITHMSTKKNIIPFTRNGTTPTHVI
jgi:hypothetical protein